jgi:hypothetical protein
MHKTKFHTESVSMFMTYLQKQFHMSSLVNTFKPKLKYRFYVVAMLLIYIKKNYT